MDKISLQVTRTRRMVHSQSAFTMSSGDLSDNDQFKRSSSVSSVNLTHENLMYAREQFLRLLCCPSCSGIEQGMLSVEGEKNVLFCPQCHEVVGLDDTMNYYDLLADLRDGCYCVDPCSACGNMDPNLFEIEMRTGSDDLELCGMKCLKCCSNEQSPHSSLSIESRQSERPERHPDLQEADVAYYGMPESEPMQVECDCGNANVELFSIVKKHSGDVESVECFICGNTLRLTHQRCSCRSDDGHDVQYDEFGYIDKIICRHCQAVQDCGALDSIPRSSADGSPKGRTQVTTLALLKRGDHVAWHQPYSYWHHAIVIAVDEENGLITVINYDGPNSHKGKIVEDKKQVNLTTEQLYRIDYADSDCYHRDEVVARAFSRLGETRYHLLNNNCEHFAAWCKTGHKLSMQRESFIRKCIDRLFNGFSAAIASMSESKIASMLGAEMIERAEDGLNALAAQSIGAVAETAKGTLSSLSGAVSTARHGRFLPVTMFAVTEIQMVLKGIKKANTMRQEGNISREEFIKITIKQVTEGVGSLTGVVIALAIPFTRNNAGMTLGSLIGNSAGCLVGRQLGVAYDKFACSI